MTMHWPQSLNSRSRCSRWFVMAWFMTTPPSSASISFSAMSAFTTTCGSRSRIMP